MTLQDMTDLVEIYEAVRENAGIVYDILFGNLEKPGRGIAIGSDDGIFGKLIKIEEIIWRNCIYYVDPERDAISVEDDPCLKMYELLDDREKTSEEKAKILMGTKAEN